ncbi:MAG: hypothetical protein JNM80_10300 [Phycisphaerae bacterium]|nr:hypothetical protein [Phycisphaerae bacterium]
MNGHHDPRRLQRLRQQREVTEMLLHRAEALAPRDAALLRAVLGDGKPAREVAVLLGLPAGGERAIRRHVSRLISRLTSPEFLVVLRHSQTWPAPCRRVATACVLHGLSIRAASRSLGISLHQVRAARAAVRALVEAASTLSPKEAA